MGDQNERIDLKTILSHRKPSKDASPVWIFDIDFQFFHIKLLTALNPLSHEIKNQRPETGSQMIALVQCDTSYQWSSTNLTPLLSEIQNLEMGRDVRYVAYRLAGPC